MWTRYYSAYILYVFRCYISKYTRRAADGWWCCNNTSTPAPPHTSLRFLDADASLDFVLSVSHQNRRPLIG